MDSIFLTQIEPITEEWVLAKMKEFNLKRKHLTADLGLTTHYLSLLFANEDNPRKIYLSKPVKAMFYYYFLTKELAK